MFYSFQQNLAAMTTIAPTTTILPRQNRQTTTSTTQVATELVHLFSLAELV